MQVIFSEMFDQCKQIVNCMKIARCLTVYTQILSQVLLSFNYLIIWFILENHSKSYPVFLFHLTSLQTQRCHMVEIFIWCIFAKYTYNTANNTGIYKGLSYYCWYEKGKKMCTSVFNNKPQTISIDCCSESFFECNSLSLLSFYT